MIRLVHTSVGRAVELSKRVLYIKGERGTSDIGHHVFGLQKTPLINNYACLKCMSSLFIKVIFAGLTRTARKQQLISEIVILTQVQTGLIILLYGK